MFAKAIMLSLFLAVSTPGCEFCDSSSPLSPSLVSTEGNGETVDPITGAKETAGNILGLAAAEPGIPQAVNGVELASIRGWWAAIYPWEFFPQYSAIHPIPELFTPYRKQSVSQVRYQEQILNSYGSGLDVLQLDPHADDFIHWNSVYLPYTRRPFFVLYEHINNGSYIPPEGSKDMNNLVNRQTFIREIGFLFDKVIYPFRSRYVTINGRAVVYLWSSGQMTGDFPSLLDEARNKYPVFFIGSNEDAGNIERIKALDGIMEYSLAGFGGGNYVTMTKINHSHFSAWRSVLDSIQGLTGKKIYLFATFQAGYDDTLAPGRNNPPLYPKTREEMIEHARLVRLDMVRWKIYDGGPFIICSEWPEGASVLPSIPRPEQPGRYVGYGTGRIDVVARFFGGR